MKKRLLTGLIIFVMFFIGIPVIGEMTGSDFGTVEAEAAVSYKLLSSSKWMKVGKYYFRIVNGKVYFSSTASGGTKLGFKGKVYSIVTNGKVIYAVENMGGESARSVAFNITCYKIAKKSRTVLKSVVQPYDEYERFGNSNKISHFYGKLLLIDTQPYFGNIGGDYKVYSYNRSTGKLQTAATNADIIERKGRYVVCSDGEYGDIEPHQYGLYKITSAGKLSLVRKLGQSRSAEIVGNRVYWCKFSGSWQRGKVYSCKLNGKNIKRHGTIIIPVEGEPLWECYDFTAKSCKVKYLRRLATGNNITFKFTYKTGKLSISKGNANDVAKVWYKELIEQIINEGYTGIYYKYADINRDGITDVMISRQTPWASLEIYTYNKGELVQLYDMSRRGAHGVRVIGYKGGFVVHFYGYGYYDEIWHDTYDYYKKISDIEYKEVASKTKTGSEWSYYSEGGSMWSISRADFNKQIKKIKTGTRKSYGYCENWTYKTK